MKLKLKYFIGMFLAIIIIAIAYFFLGEISMSFFYFILVIALIISVLPFIIVLIISQDEQKEKEEKFLEFTRDLVENVKSGTPINKAIINLQNRNYGQLSPHIRKLANQIAIGISLELSLNTFGRETKSNVIARSVILISEAQKAGGTIDTILESLSKSVNQTEELKKERKSTISNLVVQGYIIFIVFIIIMLVLEFSIFPLIIEFSKGEKQGLNERTSGIVTEEQLSRPLFIMILIQSFFAGLVIGKISEGSMVSGIKHSFILLTLTLLITTGTEAILG